MRSIDGTFSGLKTANLKEKWKGQAIIGFGERRRTYKLEAGFIKDEKTGKQKL